MKALLRAAPRNLVLASVPEEVRRRLLARAELWELQEGSILYRPGDPRTHSIFPLCGVLVGLNTSEHGKVIARWTRGRESVPYPLFAWPSPGSMMIVELPGRAIAVPLADARAMLETSMEFLRAVLASFVYADIDAQMGVMCRHHALRERLASWLLLLDTYNEGAGVPVTHERIADSIGTSRPAASAELAHLQAGGLVDLQRGSIEIRDREALAAVACYCRERATRLAASFAEGHLAWHDTFLPL